MFPLSKAQKLDCLMDLKLQNDYFGLSMSLSDPIKLTRIIVVFLIPRSTYVPVLVLSNDVDSVE